MPSQLCIKQSSLYVNNLFKNENKGSGEKRNGKRNNANIIQITEKGRIRGFWL